MTSSRSPRIFALAGLLVLVGIVFPVPAAQAEESEKFANLKVFPTDVDHDELIQAMRNFSRALGVHCNYCHVRKDGNPRGEMDWASDAKPEKTTTRIMMQLTESLNATQLTKITTKHADRVTVQCRTCHHGASRPFLVEDLLAQSYQAGGLDSLTAEYEILRHEYYGTDTYNFGVRMLPALGARLGGADPQVGVKLAEYNLRQFPQSGEAYLELGQAYTVADEKEKATTALNKAAELEPELKENVQRMLQRLQQAK